MQNYKLFVITGLSGAGKTSLAEEIINRFGQELNLKKIVSYTTRQPRTGEVAGRDYMFVSAEIFDKLAAKDFFLETSCYNGNFYGTPMREKENLNQKNNLLVVTDIKGAIALKDLYKKQAYIIFIGVSSLEDAKQRLIKRGLDSAQELENRYTCNKRDLAFFENHKHRFSLFVYNDIFSVALEEIYNFIKIVIAKHD